LLLFRLLFKKKKNDKHKKKGREGGNGFRMIKQKKKIAKGILEREEVRKRYRKYTHTVTHRYNRRKEGTKET